MSKKAHSGWGAPMHAHLYGCLAVLAAFDVHAAVHACSALCKAALAILATHACLQSCCTAAKAGSSHAGMHLLVSITHPLHCPPSALLMRRGQCMTINAIFLYTIDTASSGQVQSCTVTWGSVHGVGLQGARGVEGHTQLLLWCSGGGWR